MHEIVVDPVFYPGIRLALDLCLEAFLGAAICLAATQAINRPASRQGYHPAKGSTGFWRIIGRLLPDLQKDLLEDVVRFRLLMHDSHDHSLHRLAIALIEFAKGILAAMSNRAHESFVRGFGQTGAVE